MSSCHAPAHLTQRWGWLLLLVGAFGLARTEASPTVESTPSRVIVVVGASGTDAYGKTFAGWAESWQKAAEAGGANLDVVGLDPPGQLDRERLSTLLGQEAKESPADLWLVLIGHGTFDGRIANFNLRGLDVSATELAEWLAPFKRPVAIIDCTASSAPFLQALSASNRVVVTATRSGAEENFTYFGGYFSRAVMDPEADLDKDGQTSLLEAFLTASAHVADFYKLEGRLATEHALLDDNGDGLGTPSDWFRGIRATKKARDGAAPDGFRAHQFHLIRSEAELRMPPETRARRNDLELTIFKLREKKGQLAEAEYYKMLEPLLLEMARLYESSEIDLPAKVEGEPAKPDSSPTTRASEPISK